MSTSIIKKLQEAQKLIYAGKQAAAAAAAAKIAPKAAENKPIRDTTVQPADVGGATPTTPQGPTSNNQEATDAALDAGPESLDLSPQGDQEVGSGATGQAGEETEELSDLNEIQPEAPPAEDDLKKALTPGNSGNTAASGNTFITNVKNFDISKLRSPFNLESYLEDPLAYIGNYVWNYDVKNPSILRFRYYLPLELDLNIATKALILKTAFQTPDLSAFNKDLETKRLLQNLFFTINFSKSVKEILELNFPKTDFSYLVTDVPAKDLTIFTNENIKFFWFWWNQVLAREAIIQPSGIRFNLTEDNALGLNCAFYFLENRLRVQQGSDPKNQSIFEFAKIKINQINKAVEEKKPLPLETTLISLIREKTFVNRNSYLDLKASSAIETSAHVNYPSSPFFSNQAQVLTDKEISGLPTPKQLNACKDNKFDKDETALRLFYKEGNDNILDKLVPSSGLGCSTETNNWPSAQNIIFDGDSIDTKEGRVNYNVLYYNNLRLSVDSIIPDRIDLYKARQVSESGRPGYNIFDEVSTYKGFNSNILIDYTGEEFANILVDKNLVPLRNSLKSKKVYENYKAAKPEWGIDNFVTKLPFFTNETKFVNRPLSPYVGCYNVGYCVEKSRRFGPPAANRFELIQKFLINPIVISTNQFLDFENTYRIYDSQIRYAESYRYKLKQIIAFSQIRYKYRQPAVFFQGNSVDFRYGPVSYSYENSLEERVLNEIDSGLSFVDLPPQELFLEVYPLRGVNNKIKLLFKKYSESAAITSKIIPRKYWPEDKSWQEAREYYLKGSGKTAKSPDEMFFASVPVRKVQLFFAKGEKPKNANDVTELYGEIDTFQTGFYKDILLEPNTKYYFLVKALSPTGLISPPSQLYEIELADDGGTVFPLVKIVEFDEVQKRPAELSFGDKFRVEPALLQQAPNPEKDDIGYLNPSVFSSMQSTRPQFKIRLTSKRTGRKVDYNVIYKKNFMNESSDAGQLNLKKTKKENILISYKTTQTKFDVLGKEDVTFGQACKLIRENIIKLLLEEGVDPTNFSGMNVNTINCKEVDQLNKKLIAIL